MEKESYTINEWVDVDLFYSNFIHDLYIKEVEVEDTLHRIVSPSLTRGVKGQWQCQKNNVCRTITAGKRTNCSCESELTVKCFPNVDPWGSQQ